jgi:maltose/moltooligosaccharide transporter
LVTVGHAAGVATAADADLFVVSAYRPQPRPGQATPSVAAGERRELYGEEAALEAILASIKELKRERARNIAHRIVKGDPAHALLDTAGSVPRTSSSSATAASAPSKVRLWDLFSGRW